MAVDKGYIKWSPLRVWEEEKVAGSLPGSTSSSLVDITLPGIQHQQSSGSSDGPGHTPIIGTLALPSITNMCAKRQPDRHALEVVEHVPGQPISVKIELGVPSLGQTTPTRSRVLTMLYRR